MTSPKPTTDKSFQMSAEIIGNKWCMEPGPVEQALRRLHQKPSNAFRMAITMGVAEFTNLVSQGGKIEN